MTICYITLLFYKSLSLGLFTSLYYYLGCCSRLLLFPTILFIRLACEAALRDLGVLGKSPKAYKKSI